MNTTIRHNTFLCNVFYYSIILFMVVITLSACYCSIKLFDSTIAIGDWAEYVTAIVALSAFIITVNEFILRKDAKQAQVLSEYNMRYSEDPNIVKVVKYLNYIDIDGEINNPHREKPSNYEVEMFMRFFEELELQMRNSRLKKEDVYYLFCYYAFKLHKNNDLRTFMGVTDYENSNNWIYYKKLMDNYKQFTNE